MVPVLISAIEHYSYCPRQCGLIHVESVFDENLLTLKGARAHERVHDGPDRLERGRKVVRGLPLWSEEYGLLGKADAIEFDGEEVLPIEYKVGKRTRHLHALFQVCAQAICLEEMLDRPVRQVALYYIASHEREVHDLSDKLRAETLEIVESVRAMVASGRLPAPVADKRCRQCSLLDACMPFAVQKAAKAVDLFTPSPEVDLP